MFNFIWRETYELARDTGFGKGKKAKALWGCSVLPVIWVVWMERNRRIFDDNSGVGVEDLWEKLGSLMTIVQ